MGVRIPIYEDRLTPQGGINAQARGVEVSDAVGRSLQNLGQAGVQYAGTEMAILKKKEDDDAVTQAGKLVSDAALHWDDYIKKSAETPGMSFDGFMPKTVKEFDGYAEQVLSGISNPKARQMAAQHFNSLRTSLGNKALTLEAQASVAARDENLEATYQNLARLAASDPSQYEIGRTILLSTIANAGYDPQTRAARAKTFLERYGEVALTGEKDRNPEAVKTLLSQAYGGGFGHSVEFTLRQEGGLNPRDSNGSPSNFGINQAANPDINVKGLTRDQAKDLYKTRYWDKIGGDELAAKNPALATAAFDTAVMSGPAKAKQMLEQSGGDPVKFLELREQFLAGLISSERAQIAAGKLKSEDAKYIPYEATWKKRNADLRTEIASSGVPGAPTISRIAQDVSIDRLPAFISAAQTEATRQQAVYRSQLTTTEGDHIAQYLNGQPPQRPLSEGEYVKAYGPIEGAQRYANYQAIATMGVDMQAMKLQTPEQIQATVERYKPDASKPGFELANKRYDMVVKAAEQVNTARQADPMAYAQQTGIGDAKPLPFNDQAAFGAELSKRVGVAATMQQTYGTPYSLLTKAEAQTLNQGFDRMTTQQRLGYLDTIRKTVTDPVAYRSLMGQIAPDSPVTAMAGMIMSKQNPVVAKGWTSDAVFAQRDVAAIMLEGEALMNPAKTAKGEDGKVGKGFPMPKEQDMRDQFTSAVGKAFAGDPNGANFAYQAVKAYYAGQSARDGDISGTLNSGRLKDAINAVTGGVTDINGKGEVVRPWGMTDERFKNGAKAAFDRAIEAAGYKGSQLDVWGAYGLQNAGDSKYLLRSGTGYLTDKAGNPIVLDLTEKPSLADQIPTGRNPAPLQPPATVKPEKMATPNTQQPKTK